MPPSSSTDSLPISYRSRASVYTSSSLHTLAADTDGLHRLLATKDITTQVIAGAFEEFAWRGLLRGTRVRDWCEGLRTLLDELHIVQDLYTALLTPSIVVLYPFLSLISAPTAVRAHFFYTPPTLPAHQLTGLDKETLVDALLCLVEGADFVGEDDLFAPVTELVLEYIGSMWRGLIAEGQKGIAVADGIAKGLVELEFEMQCQGNRPSLRAFIFPIIRRIRFDLGLVTSFQLVSRLKAHADQLSHIPSKCDPHHIITAWSLRRLNTSTSPQKVYDELVFIRERIRDKGMQQVVQEVMSRLGLEKKDTQDQSDTESSPSSTGRQIPSTSSKKGFSLFSNSKKAAARKTMIALKPSPLRSSSDGKDQSSSFLNLPAGFNPDRRPSLPMISSMSYQQTRLNLSSPLKSSSLTSFQSADSYESADSRRSSPHSQIQTSDLLSQIMTFSEASDVRLILLDYIVETRYRLNSGGEADWYFGNGRELAASTFDTLEGRLVGKRDVMGLEAVFKEIRGKFDIPAPGSPIRVGGRSRRRGTMNRSRERELNQDVPKDMTESRGVSFELDSYYHHHIPEEDELDQEIDQDNRTEESSSTETVKARRKSTGATSVFSLSSAISTAVAPTEGNTRSSFFSNYAFSIREAKVQYPLEAIAVDQGRLQSHPDDTLDRHLSVPSPYKTFFPSRSESSLADTTHARMPTPSLRHRREALQLHTARTSPTTSTHLGVPRPHSPAGSFHSLLSALDLETSIPIDLLEMFPIPVISPPLTPLGSTGDQNRARRKQNRQYVVVDQELERSPHAEFQSFPEEVSTPTLEPTRKRYASTNSIPASLSTLDSIDEYPLARLEPRAELPLAKLLALFMDPAGPGGLAGTQEGTRPEDVRRAAEGFISGDMRYAEELGSGWDAEDQRRVIWLLRQIAALIADPILQYPIHQQIHHLIRNPPPSSRSSLISTSSGNTASSGSTSRYLATPPTAPRPPPHPHTQGLDVTLGSARSVNTVGSRDSVGTFGYRRSLDKDKLEGGGGQRLSFA